MNALADTLAVQFRKHANELPGSDQKRIVALRNRAFSNFEQSGVPSLRHEDWKYTDLKALRETNFVALGQPRLGPPSDLKLTDLPFPEFTPHVAVFFNGEFRPNLSTLNELPAGVTCATIGALIEQDGDDLAGRLDEHDTAFASLNNAMLRDGVVIELSASRTLEDPIHVIFLSGEAPRPQLNSARLVINAGENSTCTVVESHYSLLGTTSMTNAVTEIAAQNNARVAHYRIQMDAPEVHHIGNVFANVARDANLSTYSFAFGGGVTRIDVNADLVGSGGSVVMNGLFMVNENQHIDHHTRVRHRVSHTYSSENYKGIADGNGRGVFNGKILVEKDAQKIEALQSSKNLLLSDNAEVDTKPELEIYADDVKCAHGATVGQLDNDAFFYLRSRGIDEQSARSILTFAFAADIAADVTIAPLRQWLEQLITTRTHATGINEIAARE